jgi:uncharacterized protein YacL
MKKLRLDKFNAFLKLEFTEEDNLWLKSGYTLRKLVGILGMALPVLLYIFLFVSSGLTAPLDSISHYYFTRVASIFTIILGSIGIFLLVYKGKKSVDFYISFIAGMFALFVLLFPTSNITGICNDANKKYSVTILSDNDFREYFHYISAAIFLLCLSFLSFFLFTKSDKPKKQRGRRKIIRNSIYRTCGVIMALSLLIILSGSLKIIPPEFYKGYHITYWMETLAIESFGFSWLIKGNTLFQDKFKEALA